jgi:hypothetical protein
MLGMGFRMGLWLWLGSGGCFASTLGTLSFSSLRTDHLPMKVHFLEAEMVGLMLARVSDSAGAVGFRLTIFSSLGTSHMTM